jgi:hypothetical protein
VAIDLGVCDPEYMVATYRGVLISVWWAVPSLEPLKRVQEQRELLRDRWPGKIAVLAIVKVDRPRQLSPEARQFSELSRRELAEICAAEATVIEAGGVGLALARMLYAAMNLVNRVRYPSRIFSSLDEGLGWFSPLAGVEVGAMRRAVEAVIRARPV